MTNEINEFNETAETYNQEMNNTNLKDIINLEPDFFNTIMSLLFGILVLAGFITTCWWILGVPRRVVTVL